MPVELHGCPHQNYAAFTRVFERKERQHSELFRIFPNSLQENSLIRVCLQKFEWKFGRIRVKNRAETWKKRGFQNIKTWPISLLKQPLEKPRLRIQSVLPPVSGILILFEKSKKEKTYFQWCSPDPVGILEWAPTRWVPNPGLAVMYYEVLRTSTATTTAVAAYALCTPAASALALPPRPVWSTTEISLYHGCSLSHTVVVVRLWWDCFFPFVELHSSIVVVFFSS